MVAGPSLGRVKDFALQKFLGKGTFGAVYQARRDDDGKVYLFTSVSPANTSLQMYRLHAVMITIRTLD